MNGEALGLIETVGLAAAMEAADTCLKSAQVSLVGYELSKGMGLVTVKILGDVSSVNAALSSASASASKVNKVYATLIIPRLANNLDILINSKDTQGIPKEKTTEQIAIVLNVDVIQKIETNDTEEKETYTCNVCKDPLCTRKKGTPRKLCIHNKEFEGDKNE